MQGIMENPTPLLTPGIDLPTSLPLVSMQRFPESCQRLSLAEPAEGTDLMKADEPERPDYQREASPSDRFYHAYRSRRISESSTESGYSSHSNASFPHSPSLSPFHSAHSVGPSPASSWYRRSSLSTFESPYEPPALSDCDSMSSVSSEEPHSPDGPWYGPRTSIEPPELSEMLLPPIQTHSPDERSFSPAHERSSSESGAAGLQASMSDIDIDKHSTFSKVVVTKFSNPPRYRLKKVKFHQCPICQKSFPRPSGLRTHMNMHTNTRPYTCPYEGCNKSFSVISNAKRHYRTHLVEFPPEQMGLPSGPYTINFSDPVVVPDFPTHSEGYYASSKTLPSIFASSLSTSSPSSFDSSCSASATSLSEPSKVGCPTTRLRSRTRDINMQQGEAAFSVSEEANGGARLGRRQNLQARPLRWLPMGPDSRTPWKAGVSPSKLRVR